MKRRTFLSAAGIFSAMTLLNLKKLFAENSYLNEEEKIWEELIDYARWSASPHNVQPWRVKIISKYEAHLYYDPMRLLPIVDPASSYITLGLGMFIEGINIAANPLGYKVIAEHASDKQLDFTAIDLKFFAKLYLVETKEKVSIDRELIKKRKTSRLHYDGRVLDMVIVNSLSSIVSSHGFHFNYSSDKMLISDVVELNSKTILKGSDDDAARNELAKWIRTSDEAAAEKKDGLWYRCMDVRAKLMQNFFCHHEKFQSKWKRKLIKRSLDKSVDGTGNIAWISGPFATRAHWNNAGVLLLQLWLEITKHNVFLHPFGAIINEPFALADFKNRIQFDESTGTLWFLFRLGYSDEPPRSFRMEVKDILIS